MNYTNESGEAMSHRLMQHFGYAHLPGDLQEISKLFCDLAQTIDTVLHEGDMKTIALIRLLDGKDAAVRQRLTDLKNDVRDERISEISKVLYPHNQNDPSKPIT